MASVGGRGQLQVFKKIRKRMSADREFKFKASPVPQTPHNPRKCVLLKLALLVRTPLWSR